MNMLPLKIALGSDHAGFSYKEEIKFFLNEKGHETKDFGTFSDESCHYPDFITPAALGIPPSRNICATGHDFVNADGSYTVIRIQRSKT